MINESDKLEREAEQVQEFTPSPRQWRGRRRDGRNSYFALHFSEGIAEFPRLKPIGYLTQAKLIRAAQAGDVDARNRLWIQHARLAISAVNEHRVPPSLVSDALQAAQLGVQRAIERFDISRLTEFSTYAFYWIRQAVRRFRIVSAQPVKIPAYLYQDYHRFRRDFYAVPTRAAWYAAYEKWQGERRLYDRLRGLDCLAEPVKWSRRLEPATTETEPVRRLIRKDIIAAVREAVASLDPREQRIIAVRHGLNGSRVCTLKKLGETLGLTRERVRQLQNEAEELLRRRLAAQDLAPPGNPNTREGENRPLEEERVDDEQDTEETTQNTKPDIEDPDEPDSAAPDAEDEGPPPGFLPFRR